MSVILLNDGMKCDAPLNEHGTRNLLKFLDILENILYVLEYPDYSECWLTYHNDRLDNIRPNQFTFPEIVKAHFDMTIGDFFTQSYEDRFKSFETACLRKCASLSHSQVKHVYEEMCYFEACSKS